MKKYKIAILGGGNVAFHLVRQITSSGHKLVQIYNRTLSTVESNADISNANSTDNIHALTSDADIYIICVKDEAIEMLVENIKLNDKLIVHTSGTTSMKLLKNSSENYGIFYPLQSFSKKLNIDFKDIPILIEANNDHALNILKDFSSSISNKVVEMSEEDRIHIHISGVFVNNFVNHLYDLSDQYLKKYHINFDILKPLIQQTTDKLNFGDPHAMQTGPAIRKDYKTISNHINHLESEPQLKAIYELLSKSIIDQTGSNKELN